MMSKYIKTLVRMTELKSSSRSYNPFCYFGNFTNKKAHLPCSISGTNFANGIHCINCIYNREDTLPGKTRKLLLKNIETTKES